MNTGPQTDPMAAAVTTDRAEARRRRRRAARRLALRYALIYAAVAVLWIVLSDRILAWLALSHDVELALASIKGVLFVAVTATLLLVLGLRYFRHLEASQERYTRLFENAVEGLTVFKVVRDHEGMLTDLELVDMNPTQRTRTGLTREEAVGRRLSRPDGLDERTRSYLEVVASAAGTGTPARSELYVESEDAYELLEAYPVGRDRWALAALDISGVRHAERALRRQEENIRRAYVDVLAAVTGGKLILLTDEELAGQLGVPLMPPEHITAPRELSEARGAIAYAAAERFPDWVPDCDVRTPVGEALVNALRHAGAGTYQLFSRDSTLQVLIRDDGPGIDFRTLPRATLQRGFSTESSLGMGFTIMLQVCERVLLSTRPGRTSVVLEFAARQPALVELDTVKAEVS
jgi:anti-sigma regulatory factor (Ser/Thr protein kinase)